MESGSDESKKDIESITQPKFRPEGILLRKKVSFPDPEESTMTAEDFRALDSERRHQEDDGVEKTEEEENGEDELDQHILNALRMPRERQFLLRLEAEFIRFVQNPSVTRLKLPQMSKYQRLLVHKASDQFHLQRVVVAAEGNKASVTLIKTPETEIPARRFEEWIERPPETADSQPKLMKIMRRDRPDKNTNSAVLARASISPSHSPPPDKTIEEREEEYMRARARIFAQSETDEAAASSCSTSQSQQPSQQQSGGISPVPLQRSSSDRQKVIRSISRDEDQFDPAYDRTLYPSPIAGVGMGVNMGMGVGMVNMGGLPGTFPGLGMHPQLPMGMPGPSMIGHPFLPPLWPPPPPPPPPPPSSDAVSPSSASSARSTYASKMATTQPPPPPPAQQFPVGFSPFMLPHGHAPPFPPPPPPNIGSGVPKYATSNAHIPYGGTGPAAGHVQGAFPGAGHFHPQHYNPPPADVHAPNTGSMPLSRGHVPWNSWDPHMSTMWTGSHPHHASQNGVESGESHEWIRPHFMVPVSTGMPQTPQFSDAPTFSAGWSTLSGPPNGKKDPSHPPPPPPPPSSAAVASTMQTSSTEAPRFFHSQDAQSYAVPPSRPPAPASGTASRSARDVSQRSNDPVQSQPSQLSAHTQPSPATPLSYAQRLQMATAAKATSGQASKPSGVPRPPQSNSVHQISDHMKNIQINQSNQR